MTFLAPGFFFASLAVAIAVVALHFIVTRQPRAGILPTARFVPDLPATATARATRPSDIPLMLLRVLVILAAGAGLAKPILKPSRGAEARVILADVSRSSADSLELRDSVRALYRTHDALVVFDSSAHLVGAGVRDSIDALGSSQGRGNLSAALISAMRAASGLRDRADSIALVIVSPLAAEEFDAATDTVRKLWPGSARIVRVGVAADTSRARRKLGIVSHSDDPLQVTVSSLSNERAATGVIVRATSNADSAAGQGSALIHWPESGRPPRAAARANRDTIGGVISGNALVVSAFERRWSYPADSIRGVEVIARWIDGEPAAIESPSGNGCLRSVAIPVSPVGDLVIRSDFERFVAALSRDCASVTSRIPADDALLARLAGAGGMASREAFRPRGDLRSPLAPWLLGIAIAAAIAEMFVRRRRLVAVLAASRASSGSRRAA
jgi:aerotolerance regulator-like protein